MNCEDPSSGDGADGARGGKLLSSRDAVCASPASLGLCSPSQAQWVGFDVALPSTLRKDVCPLVHLCGKSVPADEEAGWWWQAEAAQLGCSVGS